MDDTATQDDTSPNPGLATPDPAAVQRLNNITSNAETTATLLAASLTSAAQIAALSAGELAEAVPDLEESVVSQVHASAVAITQRNELFLAGVAPSMSGELGPLRTTLANPPADAPVNLDTLFGDSVATKCGDGASVLSPAAYLVDLLEFLPVKVREKLKTRRPDIERLELSNANTNTEVPYIDLVNEILASFLGNNSTESNPVIETFNSRPEDDVAQLLAEPAAPNDIAERAYERLKNTVTPIGILPFDRDLQQTRVLLEKLGVRREVLLRAFASPGEPATRAADAEFLGITGAEYVFFAGEGFAKKNEAESQDDHKIKTGVTEVAEFWGYDNPAALRDDFTGIARVKSQFLPRTGYSYDDLFALLSTRFVNGDVPNVLLKANQRLEELWSLVDWDSDAYAEHEDQNPASDKWARLLGSEGLDVPTDSSVAAQVVKAFSRLPSLIVITSLPLSIDETLPGQTSRFSLPSHLYWAAEGETLTNDNYLGYLDESGIGHTYSGINDEISEFRLERDGRFLIISQNDKAPIEFYQSSEFEDPNKFLWLRWPDRHSNTIARLERHGRIAGDFVLESGFQRARMAGPPGSSPVLGWVMTTAQTDGEPDPAHMTLRTLGGQALSLAQWRRINAFVRVQKRLGWSISQTDAALSAIDAEPGTPEFIKKLALLARLREITGCSIEEAGVFFNESMSLALYRALFPVSIVRATDAVFGLSNAGLPLFNGNNLLVKDHAVGIAAAFGVTPSDILGFLEIITINSEDQVVSFEILAVLYRMVILSRALGQPVVELASLLAISGVEKGSFNATKSLDFMLFWSRALPAFGVKPRELHYILSGNDGITTGLRPSEASVIHVAQQVTKAAGEEKPVDKVLAVFSAVFGSVSLDIIALLLDAPSVVAQVNESHNLSWPPILDGVHMFSGHFVPEVTGEYNITVGKGEAPKLEADLVSSKDGEEPIDEKPELPLTARPLGPGTYNLVGGQSYRIHGADIQISLKSDAKFDYKRLCLSNAVVEHIKRHVLILSRYAALFSIFTIPQKDHAIFIEIFQLPEKQEESGEKFLENLQTYAALKSLTTTDKSPDMLLRGHVVTKAVAASTYADVTGWDIKTATSLIDQLPEVKNGRVELSFDTLAITVSRYVLLKKLGLANAQQLHDWAKPLTSHSQTAFQVRQVARATVDEATWAQTASDLFNPLRIASRDALTAACLEVIPKAQDVNGLFEFFLIDVSMGSCLRASRIKQAISSIQILVQRCLLGLEPELPQNLFTQDHLDAWSWKKSFDPWQANRKVLLYPENWLEPSLRDDKTPLFKTIETELEQGKATTALAVAKYVAGMVELADLEPVAVQSGNKREHMFARTRMAPYKFYYRTYDLATKNYSPWEEVHADIPVLSIARSWKNPPPRHTGNDHPNPFDAQLGQLGRKRSTQDVADFLKRRPNVAVTSGSYLYPVNIDVDDKVVLFIPTLTEQAVKADNGDKNDTRMVYHWQIGMGVSERRNGQWQPKQTATETISTLGDPKPSTTMEQFRFTSSLGIGHQDLDNHLINQGLFSFTPSVESGGVVSIQVFLRALTRRSEYTLPMTLSYDDTVERQFLGEFVYEKGHVHLRKSRKDWLSDVTIAIDDSSKGPPGEDWLFQSKRFSREDGTAIESTIWSAGGSPESPYLWQPWLPVAFDWTPKAVSGALPSEAASLERLWKKTASVRQKSVIMKDKILLPVTNNFAFLAQQRLTSGGYKAALALFDDSIAWPRVDRYNDIALDRALSLTKATTVLHHGLGLTDVSARPQYGYHETHTPISQYNWELCLHLPMSLVSAFMHQQRLDDAIDAIRLVFDPSAARPGDRSRAWRFLPFREATRAGTVFASLLTEEDWAEWARTPFRPFAVARQRHAAYMKWFVHKYIEIMVAKGDAYFRRFTLESVSLAIQCYVEAAHVYGPPPAQVASVGRRGVLSYADAATTGWNKENNVLVNMETMFPFRNEASPNTIEVAVGPGRVNMFGTAVGFYFCAPANPAAAQLRTLIDDRLYKIRHCQDIDGNVRSLALWEMPMDPGDLVRAAVAGGASLGSLIDYPAGTLPNYRFAYLVRLAFDACAEVKSLGSSILSLRERKDADQLAFLHLDQQKAIGRRLLDLRQAEVDEADKSIQTHRLSRQGALDRLRFYTALLGKRVTDLYTQGEPVKLLNYPMGKAGITSSMTGGEVSVSIGGDSALPLSRYEDSEVRNALQSLVLSTQATEFDIIASYVGTLPTITIETAPLGVGGAVSVGGGELSNVVRAASSAMRGLSDSSRFLSENAARWAQFERQTQERTLQANQAARELAVSDAEDEERQGRLDQAKRRLEMEQQAQDHLDETDAFLRARYTSTELLTWSINGLQALYYKMYNVALDLAAQAEQAFRAERDLGSSQQSTPFIQGGYWNAGRDGLYAGEQLSLAIHRLQQAHAQDRGHDYELTRAVSLRQLNPQALENLRNGMGDKTNIVHTTGEFDLSEIFWDMDFPGHVNRRIRSVAVSVPCIVGPYTSINATLALSSSVYRSASDNLIEVPLSSVPTHSVAVSSAQQDAGVFELSFRDERYMPFENAGAISTWTLTIDSPRPLFDYSTISDVVLHVRYTASKPPTNAMVTAARTRVDDALRKVENLGSLCLLHDVRAESATAWAAFRATGALGIKQLSHRRPYFAQGVDCVVFGVTIDVEHDATAAGKTLSLTTGGETTKSFDFPLGSGSGKVKSVVFVDLTKPEMEKIKWPVGQSIEEDWNFSFKDGTTQENAVAARGITSWRLLVHYSFAPASTQ